MELALNRLIKEIEDFYAKPLEEGISSEVRPEEIRNHLTENYDFEQPVPLDAIIADVSSMLRKWNIHNTHPRYFGLYNPGVGLASIAADSLVALYNPQLASWSHAPAANEIEHFTLKFLLSQFGFNPETSAANFTIGGSEANLSAVIAALTDKFPEYGEVGIRGLSAQPLIYVSEEAHHSFIKIAHMTGLGRNAIRIVQTDTNLKLDLLDLASQIAHDRSQGYAPFFLVGTAGTTGAGIIDPLQELAEFCQREGLWFHVDAAWAGAAVLSPSLKPFLQGIEQADSLTCDAHKWFSVSMGAGMFFCRHPDAVYEAFRVKASYMPQETSAIMDQYATTVQWSRRFTGLKVFMTLVEQGREDFVNLVETQARLGERLRQVLRENGWTILNDTPLPVVCFTHPKLADKESLSAVVQQLTAGQKIWLTEVVLQNRIPALRAGIINFRTTEEDVEYLIKEMGKVIP